MVSAFSKPKNENLNRQVSVFLFLFPGIYTIIQNRFILGLIFLVSALVLQCTLIKTKKTTRWGKLADNFSPYFLNSLVWVFWMMLCLTTLTFPNFSWAFQVPGSLSVSPFLWMQVVFFIGLIGAFKNLSDKETNANDISTLTARFWFWAILVFGVFMRVYRLSDPEGSYGYDEAAGIMAIRLVRDFQDYQQGYFVAYYLRPITCYFTVFLWHWFPNDSGLLIFRLSAIICDLGNIWLLYLTGKEIGGRRTGILAAAIGAVSKPLLNFTGMGVGQVSMIPFFILLPLLFTLRLFKKPSLDHFLQLGFALSLGIYNNDYIRVGLMFFISSLFVWLVFKRENQVFKSLMGPIVLLNGAVLSFYYFYINFGSARSSWIYQLFDRWRVELFIFMFLCFLILILLNYVPQFKLKSAPKNKIWVNAFLGFWVCTLLDYPIMTRAEILERLDNLVNRGGGALSESLMALWSKIIGANQLLFWYGTWPPNMGLSGDAFFGFGEVVVIFLGFAYLIAKPNWTRVFVFFIMVGGVLPHALAGGTSNARPAGAIGPLFILGALALNELLKNTLRLPRGRWFYSGAIVLLIAFWAWTAQTNYSRVYHQWFDQQTLFFTSARTMAVQETALGRQVYFADDIFSSESVVINEGLLIHRIYTDNIIYENPQDKLRDVSILIHDFSSGPCKELHEKLNKIFPEAVWTSQNEMNLCRISSASILKKRQQMFEYREEPKLKWKREYIENGCGLIFDLIGYEDRVTNVFDPVGPEYAKAYQDSANQFNEAVRYSTTIHLDREGDYIIRYKTSNRSSLKIDEQMVLDIYFFKLLDYRALEKEGEKTIHLAPGDHAVQVVTSFQRSAQPPEIFIQLKGAAVPGVSLWSSFNF
jgi:hypothetical protein